MSMPLMLALAASLGVMQGRTEIRGTVVDEAGKPAAGADVFASRRSLAPDGTMETMARTTADPQGRFTLQTPVGGNWEWWFVWASQDSHGLGLGSVIAPQEPGQDVPPVALGLRPEGPRTITLKDHDGRPIAGAAIAPYVVNRDAVRPGLAKLPEGLASRLGVTTDEQGRTTIRGLATDDMVLAVRVTVPGLGSQVVDLVDRDQVKAREYPPSRSRSESVMLELPAFGRLAGAVHRRDGSPVAHIEVEVWSRGTSYSDPSPVRFADGPIRTGADGEFRTPEGLQSGLLYRVVIRPEGVEPILSD
jgi:hypothetical protein